MKNFFKLFRAIEYGDVKQVNELMEQDDELDANYLFDGFLPVLMHAVHCRSKEIVKSLLERGG
jgi:hypothetical protein